MKTLATLHRKAVNQAAHAAAVRFEIETRDKWLRGLTEALEAGATFQELQEEIEALPLAPTGAAHLARLESELVNYSADTDCLGALV